MVLESYDQSCDACARTGAKMCDACWIHFERKCVNCGGVEYLPRITRGNFKRKVKEALDAKKRSRGGD